MVKKLFWIGLLVLGGLWFFGYLSSGRVSSPSPAMKVLHTVTSWKVEQDLREIAKKVLAENAVGKAAPNRDTFKSWYEINFNCSGERCGLDHFGNSYRVGWEGNFWSIISDGPDGEPKSDDDLMVTVELLL